MPIYAFQCAECGHDFDRLQKMADPDPDVCPECGAHAVKRQLTAPSFRLAGSGWYETDFKKGSDKKRNLAEGGEGSSKSEGKSDSKSESKPESKSDAKPSGESKSGDSKPAAPKADAKPAASPKSSD